MIFTPGKVYFLRERDFLTRKVSPYVKIGIVRNEKESEKRIKEHQTGNPREIYNYADIEAPFVEKLETQLHYLFAEKWITGEWFLLNANELENVIAKGNKIAEEQKSLEALFTHADELKPQISNGKTIVATSDIIELHTSFNKLKEELDSIKAEEEIISRSFRQVLGNNLAIDGIASWQAKNDVEKFDEESFAAEHPKLYKELQKSKETLKQSFLVKGKANLSKSNPSLKAALDSTKAPTTPLSSELTGVTIEPNHELKKQHLSLIRLQTRKVQCEWEISKLEAQLKNEIGTNDEIDGLITWKRSYETKESLDKSSLKRDHREIYDKYVSVQPGSSSFVINKWRPYAH